MGSGWTQLKFCCRVLVHEIYSEKPMRINDMFYPRASPILCIIASLFKSPLILDSLRW